MPYEMWNVRVSPGLHPTKKKETRECGRWEQLRGRKEEKKYNPGNKREKKQQTVPFHSQCFTETIQGPSNGV